MTYKSHKPPICKQCTPNPCIYSHHETKSESFGTTLMCMYNTIHFGQVHLGYKDNNGRQLQSFGHRKYEGSKWAAENS